MTVNGGRLHGEKLHTKLIHFTEYY